MISIVDPTSEPDWDDTLAAFPNATPFHSADWFRVIKDTYGFRPCCFVAIHGGETVALRPMMEATTWGTRRRGICLPFTDECRMLSRSGDAVPEIERSVLSHATSRGWKFAEFRGTESMVGNGDRVTRFVRHELDLTVGIERIEAGLHSSNRRAIRKARKAGVAVTFESSLEAMRTFFAIHVLTRQRQGVPPQPWAFFCNIANNMLGPRKGFVALARIDGTPVAGAVFFTAFGRAVYKFGASDARFQTERPNNATMWESIVRLIDAGCVTLDFGRTERSQGGLRAFKSGWGAVESALDYQRLDPRTGMLTTKVNGSRFVTVFAAGFRVMPRPLLRLFGTILYRCAA